MIPRRSSAEGASEGASRSGANSTAAPSVSLPKGGGAIRGIGEKFSANPVTGTGSMSVPISTSPGRSGFGPQLSLSYDSGAGNGPFGFGWSLSLPQIVRKTETGLPQYRDADESDVFILSGAEDLVSLLNPDGSRFEDTNTAPGYIVHRYRPRIEGLFARIERWTRSDGDVHWRSISRDNILTLYGKDENARIVDPADSTRIFSWLICETRDDKGNAVLYEYKPEDGAGVDLTRAHERNRGDRNDPRRTANRYLKQIYYGNRTPLLDEAGHRPRFLTAEQLQKASWMFEVVVDYGEHGADAPKPDDAGEWTFRGDPFSSYRAGFEVRTCRLCERVLMFHHFAGEAGVGNDCLVRSTDFTYSHEQNPESVRNPVYTFLLAVAHSGYKRHNDAYLKRSLPPVEFEYSQPIVQDTVHEVDSDSLENLPIGLDGAAYQWTDLHGEGIPGILTGQAGAWFYKRNLSPISVKPAQGVAHTEAKFTGLELVAIKPNLTLGRGHAQFMDLAGDGQPDLVVLDGPVPGLYEHDGNESWQSFQPFPSPLNRDTSDPNLRFVDLDGDGHTDVLITEADALVWHPSLAEQGFGVACRVAQPSDEEKGPRLFFADGTESIYLADLSGDGLTDLVRIRNGEVCYWPNLGYGRFGAKVTMDRAPRFDHADQFDQQRIRLADIDGTGTTDIIYLHHDGIRLYFNQSGNSWSEPQTLSVFPSVNDAVSIVPTDLLGNGTVCLVWSSPLPGDAGRQMRYVPLMGVVKPHLLVRTVNNLGAETCVQYTSSTKFYLQDKYAGSPWITRLPFPVHVVERVETHDHISRNRFVTRFTYHHGYFDGEEREFRGFGRVEQWDTEEFGALTSDATLPEVMNLAGASHVPPVLIKTWFHIGAFLDRDHISRQFEAEYYREPGSSDLQFLAQLLPDTTVPSDLSIEEEREACRALKGSILRQEIYALDSTDKESHPYSVSERDYAVNRLQPRGKCKHAVFFVHERETVAYQYERRPADPRIAHALTLEVDPYGNVLKEIAIGYGRRQGQSPLQADDKEKQERTFITYTQNDVSNPIDDVANYPDHHRTPLPAEARTYELTGFEPEGDAERFSFDEWTRDGFALVASASEIPYEQVADRVSKQKRLIEQSRTLYRRDDLTALLPLGELEPLALPGEAFKLAFTPGLLAMVFQRDGRPLLPNPADVLAGQGGDSGGYVVSQDLKGAGAFPNTDPADHWWIPTSRVFLSPNSNDTAAQEQAYAQSHFFLPQRYRDAFGHDTEITYDGPADRNAPMYDLLVTQTRDALGNTVIAANDYRVLQPFRVMDPNRNRTEVAFDALGLMVGTAVMGKLDENLGDALRDFEADLAQTAIDALFDHHDPHALAADLLGTATRRIVYDVDRYYRTSDPKEPPFTAIIARETHVSGPVPEGGLRTQVSFSYSDGFGREIQEKIQAEPGPAPERDANGTIIVGPDGLPEMTGHEVSPRWVGSGWTVFNNKGKPVRQYEPFFTDTHRFEFDVRIGVSPVIFYDPVERVVATLHPNHTWEKVVFDAWRQETWDVSDTLLVADPRDDPAAGDFFRRLPEGDYLPTWHAQRQGGLLGPHEQAAADKAAIHAESATVAHFDSLGRTFLTLAHNKLKRNDTPIEEFHHTRVVFDIEGNQREVIDALDRVVMRYDYDMLGNRIHQASMDAGERWMLNDVTGNPIRAWDSRDHQSRTVYDPLRRPIEAYLREGTHAESLVGRTVYGESQSNPEAANLRGQVVQIFDQAGVVTSDEYDFKGNPLVGRRQLAKEYKALLDWSAGVPLEAGLYASQTRYDALDRPSELTAPDGSIIRPGYNEANLLDRVEVNLRGAATATLFVADIDYDAKGQRQVIEYGNGARTAYTYDPLTFRLTRLHTTRSSGADILQDLQYTYDPIGNITHIRDDAQQTIYFKNAVVEPHTDYTYDALYRLIDATGREHIGQTPNDFPEHRPELKPHYDFNDSTRRGLSHPNDGQAMRRYTEAYDYDAVGNMLAMTHQANRGSWTRHYEYAVESNRLLSTSLPGDPEDGPYSAKYEYDAHGNMTAMPHLSLMQWDFSDQLQATSKQLVNNGGTPEITYYVYDAIGQRVRKVTERQAAAGQVPTRMAERIYIGDFEVYREYAADGDTVTLERETLHMMDDRQRVALVETRTHGNDPALVQAIRYQCGNHLNSASLEVDDQAQIISYEEYCPYGSTSYQAVRSQTETPKRYRYTATERDDETGLSYNEARYYVSWLNRWISADPIGLEDGTNLYSYVGNNPINLMDPQGTQGDEPPTDSPDRYKLYKPQGSGLKAKGEEQAHFAVESQVRALYKEYAKKSSKEKTRDTPIRPHKGADSKVRTLLKTIETVDSPDQLRNIVRKIVTVQG